MTIDSDVIERPSLRYVTNAAGAFALTASGLVIFIPATIFLASSGDASVPDWLALLIPMTLWVSGLIPVMRPARAGIQTAAGFLLILMSVLVPNGPAWIPVSIAGFAVVVGAIFTLRTWQAGIVIGLSALLDLYIGYSQSTSVGLFGVTIVAPWAGALLQVLAGGGLLLAWHVWMGNVRFADREFEQIQTAVESEEQSKAIEAGIAAVARRIHETILNTLAAIGMGLTEASDQTARDACRRNLEQLERGLQLPLQSNIRSIIDSALQVLGSTELRCSVVIKNDVEVDSYTAIALRDAIVEALRNVERHSGVLDAQADVEVGNRIVIRISDQGIGLTSIGHERFGLRNAIRANMASIGGSAMLSRNDAGGTTVTLECPINPRRTTQVPTFPTLGAADSSLLGRFGAAGTNIFMLVITAYVVREFPNPQAIALSIAAYVATIFVLAMFWQSRVRLVISLVGLALMPLPFIIAGLGPLTCVAAPGAQGIITGMAGGGVLVLLVALQSGLGRLAVIVLAVAGSFFLSARLPVSCQQEAFLASTVNLIYMVAISLMLTWIDRSFDVRRQAARDAWEDLLEDRVARQRYEAELSSWELVGNATRELLESIARGDRKASEPAIQQAAVRQAEILRAELGLVPASGVMTGEVVSRLGGIADEVGVTFQAESLMTLERKDPLPESILQLLDQMVRRSAGHTVTMRAVIDEEYEDLVFVLPEVAVVGIADSTIDGVLIECDIDSDGLAHLSLRRRVT